MAITTAMCNSYKRELFEGLHDHKSSGNAFKMALYLSSAILNKDTEQYTATNESSGAGYVAGGENLVNINPALDGDVAHTQFNNVTWSASSITARGCLIYNSDAANASVSVHDFGQDYISSNGDFNVIMPTNNGTTGLLRLV